VEQAAKGSISLAATVGTAAGWTGRPCVYLGGKEGPRRTAQIVVAGEARRVGRVQWRIAHTPQPAPAANGRERGAEPQSPA
jgi:hypothetical protein